MSYVDSHYHYNDYNELNNTTNITNEFTNTFMIFSFLFFDIIIASRCICYFFFKGNNNELNTNLINDYEEVDYLPEEENDICSICLEKYFDEENLKKVVKLKCNHLFHKECIDSWIRINKNCPMCKSVL